MPDLSLEVSCRQLQDCLQQGRNIYLLDCRTHEEFQQAAIEGAHLIPMSELPARLQELPAEGTMPIVVYCHHGLRSLSVAQWLMQQGFNNAKSLAGGIDAWAQWIDPSVPRY